MKTLKLDRCHWRNCSCGWQRTDMFGWRTGNCP